jgi:hypothetical protein
VATGCGLSLVVFVDDREEAAGEVVSALEWLKSGRWRGMVCRSGRSLGGLGAIVGRWQERWLVMRRRGMCARQRARSLIRLAAKRERGNQESPGERESSDACERQGNEDRTGTGRRDRSGSGESSVLLATRVIHSRRIEQERTSHRAIVSSHKDSFTAPPKP